MTIMEISQFKEHYEKEELRKGGGSAIFGKDSMLKAKKFRAAVDDGREQAQLTGADTGRRPAAAGYPCRRPPCVLAPLTVP